MTMVIMVTRPPSGSWEVAVVLSQPGPRRAQSVMQRQRGYIEEPVIVSGQRALVCAIRTSQPAPWRTITRLLSGSGSGAAVQCWQVNMSIGCVSLPVVGLIFASTTRNPDSQRVRKQG
jgi:hypothetical protein